MAVLEIRSFEDPVLRKKAKAVTRVNNAVRRVLDDMLDTMRVANGAGLAAPQIGLSKRMVVVDVGEAPFFLVNPEIISSSAETEVKWEGCLSWPGYIGEVERPLHVTVKALDRDGHDIWVEGDGFLARALCHEIDHLDGILFTDKAETISEVPREEAGEVVAEQERELTAVFMGSPEFAVPSLDELVQSGVRVGLVVTQPDRPAGRRQALKPTAVKERALALGIPVMACESVAAPEVVKVVCDQKPDLVVVAAFGQKLPREVLEAPALACLNVHPSLLPLYRGGNPVQRAVMNGDALTGVTIIHLAERMDSGDIAVQRAVEIGPDETYGTLESRLSSLGAHALIEAIGLLRAGSAPRVAQDESRATPARHLRRGEDIIDWARPAREVHNLVRGLSPKPGAVTWYGGERIKVWETRLLAGRMPGMQPGALVGMEGDAALVAAGDGVVAVVEVQPEGKNSMTAKAFLAGRRDGASGFGQG